MVCFQNSRKRILSTKHSLSLKMVPIIASAPCRSDQSLTVHFIDKIGFNLHSFIGSIKMCRILLPITCANCLFRGGISSSSELSLSSQFYIKLKLYKLFCIELFINGVNFFLSKLSCWCQVKLHINHRKCTQRTNKWWNTSFMNFSHLQLTVQFIFAWLPLNVLHDNLKKKSKNFIVNYWLWMCTLQLDPSKS